MENLSAKLRYNNVVNTIKALIRIMRPKQWTKNLIVFAALLFSDNLFNMELLKLSVSGFFLFCMFSGSVYVINDIVDIEKDRKHPKKCKRPLPAGHISVRQALGFVIIIFSLTVLASYRLNPLFSAIGIAYFILVTFYSFYLKNVVILDVMTIALGFVLRAVGGTVLIHVKISPWLLLCTILLSMFLALHKRKSELELVANGNKGSRKILEDYTPELINDMLHIVTSSTVMAYSLYTFTGTHSIYMMSTIPFVIYGIFRYQYIAHTKDMGENPELVLLNDIPLIVNILLWVVSCIVILYWL
ncbi:decaprenyl-phosphate phosphoribosyltransferase [Geosporobacter ferrireducens]|uniref:decaprenyl-phosphate phosphoribosyltransferase n=1 Tax=Geosporobacter ferrireducens TaxID=1424294 RepID=UPI00139E8923|nr:decaprenyl-phosphate phosphoribosyltransferase [Geosporobacter ferrireducens]MTI53304.1 decaprenyl-phosphate phosphoribosyltransferase [Geosporobacter ferrireducens]